MKESVAPIMRITDVDRAVEWYQRLGFGKAGEHRFEPDMPAYVFIARGDVWLHLSQHEGDARPGTLVYLLVEDVDAIANDFGVEVEDNPWGRDIVLRDPDGNRLRIGSPDPFRGRRAGSRSMRLHASFRRRGNRVTWWRQISERADLKEHRSGSLCIGSLMDRQGRIRPTSSR